MTAKIESTQSSALNAEAIAEAIAGDALRLRHSTTPPDSALNWGIPLSIEAQLLPVKLIEPSMLPDSLRPWLIDIADRMRCPLDFVAAAAVVMVSSLIGTRLTIKPKANDDWTVTPNLWGAVIGDPSAMKTPSVAEVFKPLNRLVAQARDQFEQALHAYQKEQITYEVRKKVFAAQEQSRLKGKPVDNPVEYPEAPSKPTERRFMTNDVTIEKLADLLNENPAGMLQFRDELTGLLAGWERAGREEDRAFYLEAWNGSGSKIVDRVGRGTFHVKSLCVSLFGGIQPAKLQVCLQAATGFDNDGFVQRLQVAVFPDRPTWAYVDELPDTMARNNAFAVIEQIANADFSTVAYQADEYNRYPYTRFDPEGQEIFKAWLTNWETAVLPAESGLLLEHFTKYRSLMPSLALIFHVMDCSAGNVPVEGGKRLVTGKAALMAVQWIDYLSSHARRIYGMLNTQQGEKTANNLLDHLRVGHLSDGFKVRDVVRKGWSGLDKTSSVEAVLAELVDRKWLKEIQPASTELGRPQSPHYLINPAINQK